MRQGGLKGQNKSAFCDITKGQLLTLLVLMHNFQKVEQVHRPETFITVSKYHKSAAGPLINNLPLSAVSVSGWKGAPAVGAVGAFSEQPPPPELLFTLRKS